MKQEWNKNYLKFSKDLANQGQEDENSYTH